MTILLDSGPSPASLHRIGLFLRCPQLYAWTYIAPPEFRLTGKKKPLVRGSLAHTGAAHHYARLRARQKGENPHDYYPPDEAIELKAASMMADYPRALVEQQREVARAMLSAYARYEPIEMDTIEILEVEHIVWFQIGPRWYTQRADLVYRDIATGKRLICDHKSSASHNVNTFSGFTPTLQMQGYRWWGPQFLGADYGGVKVNVLGAEPPYKVERFTLPNAPMLVRRFPQTVMDAEAAIERLIAEGRPYDQWPPASDELVCVHRYGRCEAWDPCLWGKEPQQGGLVQLGGGDGFAQGETVTTFGGPKT